MHVLVLGAGLSGVASAWYLRQAGHEVTVIDRQPGVALETSFANGGQVSVSHPEPWANPRAPAQILRWLGREDAPLLFRPRADWRQWAWGLRFLAECLPGRSLRNAEAVARLAVFSLACLRDLRDSTQMTYDRLDRGILHLFFDAGEMAEAGPRAAFLRRFGIRADILDARGCTEVEPALAASGSGFVGGLYAPEDESGDACAFTRQLAARGGNLGVAFRFDRRIESLEVRGGRVDAVHLSAPDGTRERLAGDAFVIALGSHGPLLLRRLGEHLPIYPVKGYAMTIPVEGHHVAPSLPGVDEKYLIAWSRLGDRLRVSATAEFSGFDKSHSERDFSHMLSTIQRLFPEGGAYDKASRWAGLRPMTPKGTPILGNSPKRNLYLNVGHGHIGWTMSMGSARIVADLVTGRTPAIDLNGLTLDAA